MTIIPSSAFKWCGTMGCIDASEAQFFLLSGNTHEFKVRSGRTGELREFVSAGCHVDNDGDISWWDFICLNDRALSVRVWND